MPVVKNHKRGRGITIKSKRKPNGESMAARSLPNGSSYDPSFIEAPAPAEQVRESLTPVVKEPPAALRPKPSKYVKVNEHGRRIGESHPHAEMTDHEVALLMELLDERETLIRESGKTPMQIFGLLKDRGLSFAQLALKFEVNKSCIAKIANGERRCQTPAEIKECP